MSTSIPSSSVFVLYKFQKILSIYRYSSWIVQESAEEKARRLAKAKEKKDLLAQKRANKKKKIEDEEKKERMAEQFRILRQNMTDALEADNTLDQWVKKEAAEYIEILLDVPRVCPLSYSKLLIFCKNSTKSQGFY